MGPHARDPLHRALVASFTAFLPLVWSILIKSAQRRTPPHDFGDSIFPGLICQTLPGPMCCRSPCCRGILLLAHFTYKDGVVPSNFNLGGRGADSSQRIRVPLPKVFAYRLLGDSPEKFRQRAEKVDENLGIFRRHVPRPLLLDIAVGKWGLVRSSCTWGDHSGKHQKSDFNCVSIKPI